MSWIANKGIKSVRFDTDRDIAATLTKKVLEIQNLDSPETKKRA